MERAGGSPRAAALIGGHANWHPPGLTFTVAVDDADHPVMKGIANFEVEDEIYMSAWDPGIHVLASAQWQEKAHPMAWTHSYGRGRVFYTTLGHGPGTFEVPTRTEPSKPQKHNQLLLVLILPAKSLGFAMPASSLDLAMPAPTLVCKLPAESLDLAMPVIKLDFELPAELLDFAWNC